jgi:hypothetical protein
MPIIDSTQTATREFIENERRNYHPYSFATAAYGNRYAAP